MILKDIQLTELPSVLAHLSDKFEQLEKSFKELKEANSTPVYNPFERLSRRDIKEQYCISLGTIHNMMRSGKLVYSKIGRKTLFKREDIERAIQKG